MKLFYKPFLSALLLLLITLSALLLQERNVFDIRTLAHIDPLPHTKALIKQEKYAKAEEYLGYFITYPYVYNNPEAIELYKEIQATRNSYEYQGAKLIEGLLEGKSDEDIGKASAIVSDFLMVGDIRDLSIEGVNFYQDKEVDGVVVALSSLGLVASVSTIYSLGATAPIKTSISVLKYAKQADKLPKWLGEVLIKEAKVAKESYSLKHIQNLLSPISELYNKVGLASTLELLSRTKNLKELKNMMRFTTKFGKKSVVLQQVTNNHATLYTPSLSKVAPRHILYASTYGESGLKALSKMGEGKFMTRMGNRVNLIKTGYKGNFNSIINYLLKHIPSWTLFSILFLGLFYFLKDFYKVMRKLL